MKTAEARGYKSAVELAAQRAVRAALDPKRIMNPRVLFYERRSEARRVGRDRPTRCGPPPYQRASWVI